MSKHADTHKRIIEETPHIRYRTSIVVWILLGLLLLFAWAVMLAFIVNYDIGDIYQFYVPDFVPVAVAASAETSAPAPSQAKTRV